MSKSNLVLKVWNNVSLGSFLDDNKSIATAREESIKISSASFKIVHFFLVNLASLQFQTLVKYMGKDHMNFPHFGFQNQIEQIAKEHWRELLT